MDREMAPSSSPSNEREEGRHSERIPLSVPLQLCTVCCLFTALLNTVLVATVGPAALQDDPAAPDYPSVSSDCHTDYRVTIHNSKNLLLT